MASRPPTSWKERCVSRSKTRIAAGLAAALDGERPSVVAEQRELPVPLVGAAQVRFMVRLRPPAGPVLHRVEAVVARRQRHRRRRRRPALAHLGLELRPQLLLEGVGVLAGLQRRNISFIAGVTFSPETSARRRIMRAMTRGFSASFSSRPSAICMISASMRDMAASSGPGLAPRPGPGAPTLLLRRARDGKGRRDARQVGAAAARAHRRRRRPVASATGS